MTPAASIYLDNNATTPVAAECIAAVSDCLALGPLNPSSKHAQGELVRQRVAEARTELAQLLSAAPAEIVYTGSGTEANHLAITSALALHPDRRHIIVSEVEHPSTLMLLRHLEQQGVRVTCLPVDTQGRLMLDALDDTLTPSTALVSLMWANNETGVLFPIAAAAKRVRARGVLFHTDAVQAVGKVPIDLARIPVDLLSLSGHKLHAPPGVGALYVRKGIKLPPQLFGHQERGRRGGTENVPGIVALGVAATRAREGLAAHTGRMTALRERLETGVLASVPYARLNGAGADRLCNTASIRFGDLDAQIVLTRLDRLGIRASAGAACSSGTTKPSHVLTAMGLSAGAALASIRFSLGPQNSAEEVDALLEVLPGVLTDLALHTA